MKIIITESQLSNVYDKFIDMLVRGTEIFGFKKVGYNQYRYHSHIKFPFYDYSTDLAFNSPEEYIFTMTSDFHINKWFKMVNVDIDEDRELFDKIRNKYLDKLEKKIKEYIKDHVG
jgi:hypothetical protein